MIFGFLTPEGPFFMVSNIPKYFKHIRKKMDTFLKHIIFVNMGIKMFDLLKVYSPFCFIRVPVLPLSNFVKMGTGNGEIWLNKNSQIIDMNFIPIKKHEMKIW